MQLGSEKWQLGYEFWQVSKVYDILVLSTGFSNNNNSVICGALI